jgi:hypothetical protein
VSDATGIATEISSLPLHDGAYAKVQNLSEQYSELLTAQAKIVAHQMGSVQVSSFHVESAYHRLRQQSASGRLEAAKLFSGTIFGVGVTLLSVALPARPVNMLLTVSGIVACVIGVAMMGWIAGTQK